jgi:hypothetical protein
MKRALWFSAVCAMLFGMAGAAWLLYRQPRSTGPETAAPWFRDVTEKVGLHFVHDPGPRAAKDYFMPGMVGSGAAVFDFNNDGRMDILLLQNGGPQSKSINRLFRQDKDGRFTDVSKGSGLDVAGAGMGVAIGDINNDGWPDVFLTEFGRVRLFRNNKNGTFTDITQEAGLDNPHWGTSAAFVDYDRDGWLDLAIVNYVYYDADKACSGPNGRHDFCGPSGFDGTVTRLFRNLGRQPGNAVRFEDRTTLSGLGAARGPGLGIVCADFNGDGWPDLFIANDGKPNHLWINGHNGTFTERAALYGVAYNGAGQAQANMGVAVGDLDGDGLFDLFVTHLPDELNVCWKQGPAAMFQDRTTMMGLANPRWRATGFGTVFGDFDHDGALDIAVANGGVRMPQREPTNDVEASDAFWGQYAERNQLFANDGKGRFRDLSESEPFCAPRAVARGLAVADLNNDGALDLLVTRIDGPARLYRNVAAHRGHWLMVRAVDPSLGGRDAYGAEVVVEAAGKRWKRSIDPAFSYLCSNDPRAHFGLGQAGRIDAIQVIWPNGVKESFDGCAVDQAIVLRKGAGPSLAQGRRRAP